MNNMYPLKLHANYNTPCDNYFILLLKNLIIIKDSI